MKKLAVGIVTLVALCCFSALPARANDAGKGLFQHCAKVRNDDTVRGYDSSLREPTIRAYKTLFPDGEPDPSSFAAQAHFRCMDARVMVCFVGANLPCARINTAKNNPGVNAFCKANRTQILFQPSPPVTPKTIDDARRR